MRGQITSYDASTTTGVIKGEDGTSYVFSRHDIHTGADILEGQGVDFVPNGSVATQIVILGFTQTASDPAAAFGSAANATPSTAPATSDYDFQSALLTYTGRMRRQHFWISFLIIFGANIILGLIPFIGWLLAFALIYPSVCISIKRLHDMGKTGWLSLVPYVGSVVSIIVMFVGGAGAFMTAAMTGGEPNPAAMMGAFGAIALGGLISLVTGLGFLIWIGVTDSQPGDNQYGPNPKGL